MLAERAAVPERPHGVMAAKRRSSRRRAWGRALLYGVLTLGAVPFLVPFVWTLSTSLKTLGEVFIYPPRWLPASLQWRNYLDVWLEGDLGLYTRNTLIIVIPTVIGQVLSNSMAGYALACLRGKGRGIVFALLISTLLLPGQVTMIPTFLLFRYLGWVGSYLPLIVPAFMGAAFYSFLLRQFYAGVSHELVDAALIDGCNYGGIWWRVMVPLSKPAMATVAIFTFMGGWNDLMGPLIYVNRMSQYTLALGLGLLRGKFAVQTPWHWLMAGSVISIAPLLVLYFAAQKVFVQGIVVSGVKG